MSENVISYVLCKAVNGASEKTDIPDSLPEESNPPCASSSEKKSTESVDQDVEDAQEKEVSSLMLRCRVSGVSSDLVTRISLKLSNIEQNHDCDRRLLNKEPSTLPAINAFCLHRESL